MKGNRELLKVSQEADKAGMTYGRYVAMISNVPMQLPHQKEKGSKGRKQPLPPSELEDEK